MGSRADGPSALIAAAESAWPGIRIDRRRFLAHLARSWEGGPKPEPARVADLYLAFGCAEGDARALAHFEAKLGPEIDTTLRRMRLSPTDAEDLKQLVRQKLFVAAPGATPKIAEFGGKGDLRGWVRVVASNTALNVLRKVRRESPAGDDLLLSLAAPDTDPELRHMKALYRKQFKEAFADALASLDAEDRTLLRQHLVDGLSIDDLAALSKIHRATAARRIAKVRDTLLDRTREGLKERLGVRKPELESIMRLIGSRLGGSLVEPLAALGVRPRK